MSTAIQTWYALHPASTEKFMEHLPGDWFIEEDGNTYYYAVGIAPDNYLTISDNHGQVDICMVGNIDYTRTVYNLNEINIAIQEIKELCS